MKKLSILLALFTFLGIFAADPAFQAKFLEALEEHNLKIRITKLIDALEVSSASECDKNVMRMLKHEEANGNLSVEHRQKLFALAEQKTNDFILLEFCMSFSNKSCPYPAALLNTAEKNILTADLSKLPADQYAAALNVIKFCNFHLTVSKERQRLEKSMDALLARYPDDLRILDLAINSAIHNCFVCCFITPKNALFADLPETDGHKKRIAMLGKKLLAMPVKNANDAAMVISAATELFLPQAPELLQKYAKLYPEYPWRPVSCAVAGAFKKPELLILADEFFMDYLSALVCRDLTGAEKMLNAVKGNLRDGIFLELQMLLWAYTGEYSKIVNVIHSGKIKNHQYNLGNMTRNSVLNAAHFQKDKDLALELFAIVLKESRLKKTFDPNNCNAVGYVCADMGLKLPESEKLIRMAVKAQPYNSAFRDSMAWVLFRQGKFAEAEREIIYALALCEPSASAAVLLLHAAEIKYALKKYDDAKTFLAQATLLYDPDDPSCAEYNLKAEKRLLRALK